MNQELSDVQLKSGGIMKVRVVQTSDKEFKKAILDFLGHKARYHTRKEGILGESMEYLFSTA